MGCGACQKRAAAIAAAVPGSGNIQLWYESEKKSPPDFHAHMETVRDLCTGIRHATEMSIWPKQAYLAIAAGMPEDGVLVSCVPGGKSWWPRMTQCLGNRFKMLGADSLAASIEPTELLFLDTHHTADRTYMELSRHADKVSKYIIIHTVAQDTFGERGDDGGPGVMAGVRRWLREGAGRTWVIKRFDTVNHGLLVLSCDPADKPRISHGVRSALRYVRSKIRHKLKGSTYLPLPMAQERLDICLTCDKRGGSEGNNCTVCKCFLAEIPDYAPVNKGQPGKAFIPTEGCPIGKWLDRPNDGVAMSAEQVEEMLDTMRQEAENLTGPETLPPVEVKKKHVWSISGDLGDIICALAIIRTLGGGDVVLFPSALTTRRMSLEWANQILPLIRSQSYISSAEFAEQPSGLNMDVWREKVEYGTQKTMLDAMSERLLGGARISHNTVWLTVEPDRRAPVVFHRTIKDRSSLKWKQLLAANPDSVFVGLPDEHHAFEDEVGPIRYAPTEDLLGFARIVAGADRLICNQSVGLMIAYGLGKSVTAGTVARGVNCRWRRDGDDYFEIES